VRPADRTDRSAFGLLAACSLIFVQVARDGERTVVNQAVGHHVFLLGLWGVALAGVLALVISPPTVWRFTVGSLGHRTFWLVFAAWAAICIVFNATANADDALVAEDVLGSLFGWMLLEELLFRGALFDLCDRVFPPNERIDPAILITTLLFALGHLQYDDFDVGKAAFTVLYVLPTGVLFGWARRRSGSIWPSVALHGVANGVTSLVYVLL
jgi:membrane protease YdiL (CAAX protease family)